MRARAIVAVAFGLLATACGGSADDERAAPTPVPSPEATCSAAGMDTSMFTENPDLTGPTNETRRAIAAAAVDCDYAALADLADEEFTYSFGDGGDPASFWRLREADGEPVLRILVTLLTLDTHVEEPTTGDLMAGTRYTWPRAYRGNGPEARAELERAFGAETVEGWYAPERYNGWRTELTGDGRWTFFVAGD